MRIWCFACLLLLLASCNNVSTDSDFELISKTFDALLQEALDDSFNQMAGVSMSVFAPELGIDFQGAAGFDSKVKEHKLSSDQPFRIASITKPFVATAILRLHEMGALDIAHAITAYISAEHIELLKKGGYQTKNITIKHCLQHTSGLFDYAVGNNTYTEMVLSNPKRKWTRTAQIQLAMDIGKPYGVPGELYHYSDTGYILLGEIIERLTNADLGRALRDLLQYDKQELFSTWLETFESNPNENKRFVNRYLGQHNTTNWDASIDLYGGGGLISTTKDLTRFFHHLFNVDIFENRNTLQVMLAAPEVVIPSKSTYHCGVYSVSLYGIKAYMHNGIWGTQLLYIPKYNCSIAINYANRSHERLLKKVFLVIKKLKEND